MKVPEKWRIRTERLRSVLGQSLLVAFDYQEPVLADKEPELVLADKELEPELAGILAAAAADKGLRLVVPGRFSMPVES